MKKESKNMQEVIQKVVENATICLPKTKTVSKILDRFQRKDEDRQSDV